MKCILISLSTPTFNNVRAASALPFHLIAGCTEHQFKVYSFNSNLVVKEEQKQTEKQLNSEVKILACPKWITWMFKFHLSFFRVFLKYPFSCYYKLPQHIIEEIRDWEPDRIWIYGEELAGIANYFNDIKTIVTMPDCESMYYHRLLSKRFATRNLKKVIKYAFAYYKYRRMERDLWRKDVKYHFVGKADAEFYKEINPLANVIFLPHPIFEYAKERTIKFHQPKIKLLVAGRYNIYMKEACDEAFQLFILNKQFTKFFELTFLGKGWDSWYNILKQNGYMCNHILFAPNYIEELIKHDIQLTPISVGTGTKGKVLDAISNGLMVIGTPFALENILVENNISCIQYNNSEELYHYLEKIPFHIEKYEQIAKEGRKCVLNNNAKETIAHQLFS